MAPRCFAVAVNGSMSDKYRYVYRADALSETEVSIESWAFAQRSVTLTGIACTSRQRAYRRARPMPGAGGPRNRRLSVLEVGAQIPCDSRVGVINGGLAQSRTDMCHLIDRIVVSAWPESQREEKLRQK